jgi:ubiquinone/menaquinone biosynthesis C-methylase UbiE
MVFFFHRQPARYRAPIRQEQQNMTTNPPINLWSSPDHARDYLERADSISHRTEGEAALLEFIPEDAHRILDLGTGDGRLLALVKRHMAAQSLVKHTSHQPEAVAIDFSPSMLEAAANASRKIPRSQ